MNTNTADLGNQIAEQRERISETVGALADKIDHIDTSELRARAESGAADLLENATDAQGRPKKGLLIGALAVVGLLVLARKFLR